MLHHLHTTTHAAATAATHAAEHATLIAARIATHVPSDIDIRPNTSALPGIPQLKEIVGAIMSIGLILAVVALIITAIVWAFGASSSNPHLASRGKTGILVGAAAGGRGRTGQLRLGPRTADLMDTCSVGIHRKCHSGRLVVTKLSIEACTCHVHERRQQDLTLVHAIDMLTGCGRV